MIVICPNCDNYIEILELNCCIFRHGVYKVSKQQINPHSPKDVIEQLIKDDLILGCGKPFKIVNGLAVVCEYI